jgi:hypothetical protein
MQSAAVALRALIMLAFVVAIPALALRDTSWSQMVDKLQNCDWTAILDVGRGQARAPAEQNARLAQSASSESAAQPLPTDQRQALAVAESFSTAKTANAQAGSDNQPVTIPNDIPVGIRGERVAIAEPSANQIEAAAARLRQLGARYYRLESWGEGPQMYHFCCDMPVADSADYTRCFEATHADPLQAIGEVQRQAENWRTLASSQPGDGRRSARDRLLTSGH